MRAVFYVNSLANIGPDRIEDAKQMNAKAKYVAEYIGEDLDVKVRRYNSGKVDADTLTIGMNGCHGLAAGLSNLPLVVLDAHSDMYADHLEQSSLSGCWIYKELAKGRTVHLVLPYDIGNISEFRRALDNSLIPDGKEKNLFVYWMDKEENHHMFDLDKFCKCVPKKVYQISKLAQLKMPKQISIDEDFIGERGWQKACLLDIFKNLEFTKKDTIDFWLEQDSKLGLDDYLTIVKSFFL